MGAHTRIIISLAVLVIFAAFPVLANAAGDEYVKATKTAIAYTVTISVADTPLGSGFVLKEGNSYYVVTYTTIAGQNQSVAVITADGKKYQADIQGSSPGASIVVFKVVNGQDTLAAATLADSKKLDVGEKILAVGNAPEYGICVTAGIISGLYETDLGGGNKSKCVQTDASISAGQVGGPLVNLNGEIVGMCIMLAAARPQPPGAAGPGGRFGRGGAQAGGARAATPGIGVALATESIQDAIKKVIQVGGVMATFQDLGFNGLQDVNDITMANLKLAKKEGALVVGLVANGPAEKAGIKPNDVITEINGKPVKNADDLKNIALTIPMGAKVTVKYVGVRNDKIIADSADFELAKPESGGISNELPPSDTDDIIQLHTAGTPISAAAMGEGLPIASAPAASEYVSPIKRASMQVMSLDNGVTAVLLPKSVAGGADTRYLVVPAHLVQNRQTVKVTFYKGTGDAREAVLVDGTIVGSDAKNDIAVISISVTGAPDQMPFASSDAIEYGTEVMAVGRDMVATAGVISVKGLKPRADLTNSFWATSACVAAVNDGGALIDKMGRFVGLCTNLDNYHAQHGISLVMPASAAVQVIKDIINNAGQTKSGYLGLVSSRDLRREELQIYNVTSGVVVLKVEEGSLAEKAGLAKGQIITKFGDTYVQNRDHLKALVAAAEIGKKITVTVRDVDGSTKTLEIEITEEK